jgi:hypothetical protein
MIDVRQRLPPRRIICDLLLGWWSSHEARRVVGGACGRTAKRVGVTSRRGKKRTTGTGSPATMVQGTAAALPEAWQSYWSVEEARSGAREILHNHRVLRVAIVEDRIPLQFVEWIGR